MILATNFPNFKNKHRYISHFSAMRFEELNDMPKNVILSYSSKLSEYIRRNIEMKRKRSGIDYVGAIVLKSYVSTDNKLMLISMPPGSPLTSTTADLLIANGAKRIIIMGCAGAINSELTFGDIVICNKAVRDEGASHHYVKSQMYVSSSNTLTNLLCGISKDLNIKFFVGPTWTTDAMFRETKREISHYSKLHIFTVEMEAAALFAVAKKRKINASAVFSISDVLYEKKWSDFHDDMHKGYRKLARIALGFKDL